MNFTMWGTLPPAVGKKRRDNKSTNEEKNTHNNKNITLIGEQKNYTSFILLQRECLLPFKRPFVITHWSKHKNIHTSKHTRTHVHINIHINADTFHTHLSFKLTYENIRVQFFPILNNCVQSSSIFLIEDGARHCSGRGNFLERLNQKRCNSRHCTIQCNTHRLRARVATGYGGGSDQQLRERECVLVRMWAQNAFAPVCVCVCDWCACMPCVGCSVVWLNKFHIAQVQKKEGVQRSSAGLPHIGQRCQHCSDPCPVAWREKNTEYKVQYIWSVTS